MVEGRRRLGRRGDGYTTYDNRSGTLMVEYRMDSTAVHLMRSIVAGGKDVACTSRLLGLTDDVHQVS